VQSTQNTQNTQNVQITQKAQYTQKMQKVQNTQNTQNNAFNAVAPPPLTHYLATVKSGKEAIKENPIWGIFPPEQKKKERDREQLAGNQ